MGFTIAMVFCFLVIPSCLKLPETKFAIIMFFIPSMVLIPKTLGRMLVQTFQGINHPGTSGILLIILHIGFTG